jgi:putative hydrolase of the HAD superfamily
MLILFDIDDTLLDHRVSEHSAATLLHQRIGASISFEEFLAKWSAATERHFSRYLAGEVSFDGQRRDRIREMVDSELSEETADQLLAGYRETYEASWSLYPDVLPCLDGLAQHRLGVISNGQGDQQRRKLARMGIADRFECAVISEDVGRAKPDVAIFLRACALLGESPANSVYVGDRYDLDAQGARAAGMQGIWLDRKKGATVEHLPPIIESLDRLVMFLKEAGHDR